MYRSFTIAVNATAPIRIDIDNTVDQALPLSYGRRLIVTNTGPADIRIGDGSVTAKQGYPLPVGATFTDTPTGSDQLYAIAVNGTAECDVLRAGTAR